MLDLKEIEEDFKLYKQYREEYINYTLDRHGYEPDEREIENNFYFFSGIDMSDSNHKRQRKEKELTDVVKKIDFEKQQEWTEKVYRANHVPFSSASLTKIALGHVRGHVTLLTACSGVGKTRFTISEMWKEIEAGNKVLYVSDETSLEILTEMIIGSQYDKEFFKDNLIYMNWFDFYEELMRLDQKKSDELFQVGVKGIFIDYLAGDLLASAMGKDNGEAYSVSMMMKEFFRIVRKISERYGLYFQINAQQIPTPIGTDIYDGYYIQSCKTLYESVDLYISLSRTEDRNVAKMSIIKNRFGNTLINIKVNVNYKECSFTDAGRPTYYDGSEVYVEKLFL